MNTSRSSKSKSKSKSKGVGAWFRVLGTAIVALSTLGLGLAASLAQDGPREGDAKTKSGKSSKSKAGAGKKTERKGGLGVPAAPNAKDIRRKAEDPFARPGVAGAPALAMPTWPYGIRFQLETVDRALLDATYYVPKIRDDGPAPVILLVHDSGSQPREFEEPIDDLKGMTLAEDFQDQGYAVLVVDFRAVQYNARREPIGKQWRGKTDDLQSVYMFMLDRHNRGDFNVSKFGVLAIGEGANLAANWASTPGAAVSSDFKVSDLAALALISPAAKLGGIELVRAVPSLAPRLDMFLATGERDKESYKPVKELQPAVERRRQSKVSFFPTNLHGGKLVRFMPKVPAAIVKFFDATIRYRVDEWEPRYNLSPVRYIGGRVFSINRPGGAADVNVNVNANAPAPAPVRKAAEPDVKNNPRPAADRKKGRR